MTSIFVPANDPNSCQWFYVYVAEIAHSCGLLENTTYIEVANEIVKVNRSLSLIRLRKCSPTIAWMEELGSKVFE
ncbi:hypothetical protein L1987_06973 [Smallanthus sonchifolius]|uniref:Uncharacterized protein n=1 Tax=Smallanthus sonchifolius TaxID=185202 RepID=A0ACB9JZT7_9ASTR|nr:hypothetical protein L1987_06973 [Smallanthus sonchifolius]